jgi:hypothetical protein
MAIIASDSGGGRDFEPIPAGGHAAVCDMLVDLGIQDGGNFGPKHQVYIRFQVPGQRIQFEKDGVEQDLPAVVGVTFTLSLSDKSNLKPFLEAWRGRKFTAEEIRGFDITGVAGKPAYLNIIHENGKGQNASKVYANIASLMPMPVGMPAPQVDGEVIVYDADNQQNFDKLPKWLRDKIDNQVKEQPRAATQPKRAAFADDLDDDVPF